MKNTSERCGRADGNAFRDTNGTADRQHPITVVLGITSGHVPSDHFFDGAVCERCVKSDARFRCVVFVHNVKVL